MNNGFTGSRWLAGIKGSALPGSGRIHPIEPSPVDDVGTRPLEGEIRSMPPRAGDARVGRTRGTARSEETSRLHPWSIRPTRESHSVRCGYNGHGSHDTTGCDTSAQHVPVFSHGIGGVMS
jgi:hypothetical protein